MDIELLQWVWMLAAVWLMVTGLDLIRRSREPGWDRGRLKARGIACLVATALLIVLFLANDPTVLRLRWVL